MSRTMIAGPRVAPTVRELRTLVELARTVGHTSGGIAMGRMDEFEVVLREHPRELVEAAGIDPMRLLAERIVEELATGDVERRCLLARVEMLGSDLAGPDPSPAESSLAAAAALAWLDWQRCMIDREEVDIADLRRAAYLDGRVHRAHARYIRTIKALAAVQKLGLPSTAIQINVGGLPGTTARPDDLAQIDRGEARATVPAMARSAVGAAR